MNMNIFQPALGADTRDECFIIMSYKEKYDPVYEEFCQLIEDHIRIRCRRADRKSEPGRYLLGKVHEMILNASVVVADVSERSPNVYYEYGYASAHDRLPILIAKQGKKMPNDLVGKEVLRYRESPASDKKFIAQFISCIKQRLNSPLPEQRKMLTSLHPFPSYVIAAPRVPGADSKHWWHPDERTTFGDMVGIVGFLTAYGNLFGSRRLPELLHGQMVNSDVLKKSANFFCIGSIKVNCATEYFLSRIQTELSPYWQMLLVGDGEDKRIIFMGDSELDEVLSDPVKKNADQSACDYGLIIRAPHPQDERHVVFIAAGRHSIGTHAACLALIRPDLIARLDKELLQKNSINISNTQQPFWAIVKGTLLHNGVFSDNVEIVKVGGYKCEGTEK